MLFADAARTYTLLTVGDGLVTQVPALIVSTAAGLLVTKAGVTGSADKALMAQLSDYPKALGMSGAVMIVMALLPGKELPKEQSELVKDIVPSQITVSGIQRVLQLLLASASRSAISPPSWRASPTPSPTRATR